MIKYKVGRVYKAVNETPLHNRFKVVKVTKNKVYYKYHPNGRNTQFFNSSAIFDHEQVWTIADIKRTITS